MNPFKFKLERRMTKAERVQSVAHVIWEEVEKNGDVTYSFLFKFFPTWSIDTIEEGMKLYENHRRLESWWRSRR